MPHIKEKKERMLGVHLHLKGERCSSPKCALVRRPYRPGIHGNKRQRKNLSDFGRQIREKQKFKLTYGVDEKNLASIFKSASKKHGAISQSVLGLLERRLDNVVFRLGFAPSRSAARTLVVQGHILVNKVRTTSPGFMVSKGTVVALRPESTAKNIFKDIRENLKKQEIPEWLKLSVENLSAQVIALPENVESQFEINLLVESFSK